MPVDRVSCFIFIIWAIDTSKNAYAANADVQENSGIPGVSLFFFLGKFNGFYPVLLL